MVVRGRENAEEVETMKVRAPLTLVALGFILLLVVPAWAGDVEPPHYFGPNVGYKDFGSSKYFYKQYPVEKWDIYGYGTGHMGMGYGPYVYGGRKSAPTVLELPDYGMPTIKPNLKWIGGNQVRVTTRPGPAAITGLTVDVLAYNGSVLETATAVAAPFEIIANLPDGAASIRVYMDLANNGFSATVFPIVPVK